MDNVYFVANDDSAVIGDNSCIYRVNNTYINYVNDKGYTNGNDKNYGYRYNDAAVVDTAANDNINRD